MGEEGGCAVQQVRQRLQAGLHAEYSDRLSKGLRSPGIL